MKTSHIALSFAVGFLIVALVKNWHSIPFVKENRDIQRLEVTAAIAPQVKLSVKNTLYVDIKDPVIECESFGESGTLISKHALTMFQIAKPNETIFLSNAFQKHSQTVRIQCNVSDVTFLETINGLTPKSIVVKKVTS